MNHRPEKASPNLYIQPSQFLQALRPVLHRELTPLASLRRATARRALRVSLTGHDLSASPTAVSPEERGPT